MSKLSESTKLLLKKLELVVNEPSDEGLVMALHVCSVITNADTPQFGVNELKLAFVELMR